jgi:hypothetical protein
MKAGQLWFAVARRVAYARTSRPWISRPIFYGKLRKLRGKLELCENLRALDEPQLVSNDEFRDFPTMNRNLFPTMNSATFLPTMNWFRW